MLALIYVSALWAPAASGEARPETKTADQWTEIAGQALKEGNRSKAVEALQAAIAADPANGAAGLLITTLHQSGRVEDAYALGERYQSNGPRNPRALFRFGWLLAFLGENTRAEALFHELVAMDKGGIYEAWGNGELAYLARARGDAQGAVSFMERAVAARPDDMISRVGLAQMRVEAGDPHTAIKSLEAELKADPAARGYGGTPAALVLAWAYQEAGDSGAAAALLDPLEKKLFANVPDGASRQLGMEPMQSARQIAFLAIAGRRDQAIALSKRTPVIPLYGAPDPRDGMFSSLQGEPNYEALLARSRAEVDAERKRLGLPPLRTFLLE
ncbi:MAG: tetratricopeptide repeat protein [Phenylobacterium sp.]